jgi:hypothetical protein
VEKVLLKDTHWGAKQTAHYQGLGAPVAYGSGDIANMAQGLIPQHYGQNWDVGIVGGIGGINRPAVNREPVGDAGSQER